MTTPVNSIFHQYQDLEGQPLQNGYVYIGTANQNPVTAPISVYWDSAMTQPAAQPLRTTNGFFSRTGTPANIFVASDYSESTYTLDGDLITTCPSALTAGAFVPSSINLTLHNVAYGTLLSNVTTAADVTAIGYNAFNALTTGNDGVAIGSGAAALVTSGIGNVAIGKDVMGVATTASYNVGIGRWALFSLTTGATNVALGADALYSATTGTSNTAVGVHAMTYSTTASNCVAIGQQALEGAVGGFTGGACNAIGDSCLANVTTAVQNDALGTNAGLGTTTGSYNVYIGTAAGYTGTPANANVSGNSNTYVGNSAGPGVVGQLSNAIGLGFGAHPLTSQQVQIGSETLPMTFKLGDSSNLSVDVYGPVFPTATVTGVTYAGRPGTPATGMMINITDSNTVTWGATIAGGGVNNVLARYNGANWTVLGI